MKHKNQARVEEKRKENIFSDSKWCLRFGYGAENKICSIKETQAFLFYLVQKFFFQIWPDLGGPDLEIWPDLAASVFCFVVFFFFFFFFF